MQTVIYKRIIKYAIMNNIGTTQLMEQFELMKRLKSMSDWYLPDSEVVRRKSLIEDLNSGIRIFKMEAIKKAMKPMLIMVYLKPITDEMLMDYTSAMFSLCDYFKFKRDKDAESFNNLTIPAIQVYMNFFCSKGWQDYIIEKEITGQGYQTINGMTIPLSVEEFKLQVSRMGVFPMIPKISINKVKSEFKKYHEQVYANEQEQSNQFGQKDKDASLETTDEILKKMFPWINSIEMETLKNNLRGKNAYIPLVYIGRKGKMEGELKKLKNAGIDKSDILRVFSSNVRWQKNNCSPALKLESEKLNKKI